MIIFFYMFCLLLWVGFLIFLYKKYKRRNDTKRNALLAGVLVVALALPTVDLFGLAWLFKDDICKNNWTGVQIVKKIPGLTNVGNDYALVDIPCPAWVASKTTYGCTSYKDKKNELITIYKQQKYNFFVFEDSQEIWDAKSRSLLGLSRHYNERQPLLFKFEFGTMTDLTCKRNPDGSVSSIGIENILENQK